MLGEVEEAVTAAQRWDVLRPESLDARESLAFVQLYEGNVEAAQSIALGRVGTGRTHVDGAGGAGRDVYTHG